MIAPQGQVNLQKIWVLEVVFADITGVSVLHLNVFQEEGMVCSLRQEFFP